MLKEEMINKLHKIDDALKNTCTFNECTCIGDPFHMKRENPFWIKINIDRPDIFNHELIVICDDLCINRNFFGNSMYELHIQYKHDAFTITLDYIKDIELVREDNPFNIHLCNFIDEMREIVRFGKTSVNMRFVTDADNTIKLVGELNSKEFTSTKEERYWYYYNKFEYTITNGLVYFNKYIDDNIMESICIDAELNQNEFGLYEFEDCFDY